MQSTEFKECSADLIVLIVYQVDASQCTEFRACMDEVVCTFYSQLLLICMDLQHMLLQVAWCYASLAACLTCVWPDASVRGHVILQITGGGEAFSTSDTVVRVDTCVLVLVFLQISRPSEIFVADIAHIWSFACMHPHVSLQST